MKSDENKTGFARNKTCKRCGADEWRKTLYGMLSRKIWLALMLVGAAMMVLAVYTAWSSVTIGLILFILSVVGLLSRHWRCAACIKPLWRKIFSAAYRWGKIAVLVVLIGYIVVAGFFSFFEAPSLDRRFRFHASMGLWQWHEEHHNQNKAMYWYERVLENPLSASTSRNSDYASLHKLADKLDKQGSQDTPSHLVQMLTHEKVSMRAAAVIALSKRDAPDTLPHIVQALNDQSALVRRCAIQALPLNRESTKPYLIKSLKDKSAIVREAALQALTWVKGTTKQELRPYFIQALRDNSPLVRAEAVNGMFLTGQKEAGNYFIQAIFRSLTDKTAVVSLVVDDWLPYVSSPALAPLLIQSIKELETKHNNSESLYRQFHKNFEKFWFRMHGLADLGYFEEPSLLLKCQYRLIKVLGYTGSQKAVPFLIQVIKDKDNENYGVYDLKRAAAMALGQIGSTDAIAFLIEALTDDDNSARSLATEALGKIGASETVPSLIQALKDDDNSVRSSAAGALGEIGALEAVPALIQALKDDDNSVRSSAAGALGEIGDSEAVPSLIQALKDDDNNVRYWVADALGKIGASEAIPSLIQALKDDDDSVKKRACRALGEIGALEAVPSLIQLIKDNKNDTSYDSGEAKEAAVGALGKIGSSEAIAFLIQVLGDDDDDVREAAAKTLGEIGASEAGSALIQVLTDDDDDVREAAATALGKIGSSEATPILIKMLNDDDDIFRIEVEKALVNIGSPDAVPHLIRAFLQYESDKMEYDHFNFRGDYLPNALTALSEKHFSRIPFKIIRERADILIPAVYNSPAYSKKLLALAYFGFQSPLNLTKLKWLDAIYKRNVQKDNFMEEEILADIRSLKADYPLEKSDNGLLFFFAAYLLKEKGYNQEALKWTEKALDADAVKNEIPFLIALRWIKAEAYMRLGRYEDALNEVDLAAQKLPEVGFYDRKITQIPFGSYTAALKGIILISLNRTHEAVLSLNAAEKLLKKNTKLTEDRRQRVEKIILAYRAKAYGQAEKADADKAIAISEKVAAHTNLERTAEAVALKTRIQAALGEGDYETAHKLTEKLALRSASQVADKGVGLNINSPEKKKVYDKIGALREEIVQINQQLDQVLQDESVPEGKQLNQLGLDAKKKKEREELLQKKREFIKKKREKQRELKKFIVGLKKTHPEMATLVGAEPIDVSLLQDRISGEQAILQYLVMADKTYLFLVTQVDIKIVELAVGQKTLRKNVKRFRDAILQDALRPSALKREQLEQLGNDLGKALIEPVSKDITAYKHLIIIPNSDLHFLPFGVLKLGDQYLAEKFLLSYLSASSLIAVVTRDVSAEKKLFAVANPSNPEFIDLKGAEAEIKKIGSFFTDKQMYTGEKAKKGLLIGKDLRGVYLHLAMHAEAGAYEKTRLILSDGYLTMPDIWGLYLNKSPLVVLSACETHLGEKMSGDEIVSLANGFIFAGAGSVVSSLWKVSDMHTMKLMELFYENMSKGKGRVEALSLAKSELIHKNKFAPFFWGAFVINGI